MLIIKYVRAELPWLKVNDVREKIIEAVSRNETLLIEGNLSARVSEILLKPGEEMNTRLTTSFRVTPTLESRANMIEGKPFQRDPRFYGLAFIDKAIEDAFGKLD